MKTDSRVILVINGGSSSIKFSIHSLNDSLQKTGSGAIENIFPGNTLFRYKTSDNTEEIYEPVAAENYAQVVEFLFDRLEKELAWDYVAAVGHRIVHGRDHHEPAIITDTLLEELKTFRNIAPEHLPGEILLIEALRNRMPGVVQLACFDTSFHQNMPLVAKQFPLPRLYYDKGIMRYGFHGLSYAYLMHRLSKEEGASVNGKIILAHLGNGASMCAVKNGVSIDTSMGFTPNAGLMMGTRCGDLDAGLAGYLMHTENMDAPQFLNLVNHKSGLLGVSATSADMRVLLKNQHTDSRAAEAVALFCYQAKKMVGAYTAVLHGLDVLVFTGGIGEHQPEIRARICEGLSYLGIEIDKTNNEKNHSLISTAASAVAVRVIPTDEEWMIASAVRNLLNFNT